ncbi:MAG: PAS domain S-box protein, partial [Microcoleaceae cyanobacterium]
MVANRVEMANSILQEFTEQYIHSLETYLLTSNRKILEEYCANTVPISEMSISDLFAVHKQALKYCLQAHSSLRECPEAPVNAVGFLERCLQPLEQKLEHQYQQIEATSKQHKAELTGLFEAMSNVVLILDGEGRYLKLPPTNPNLLYKPRAELIGKTIYEVFPLQQAECYMGLIQQALHTQQPITTEYQLNIQGQETWFSAKIAPLSDSTVIWVADDITGRKHTEAALKQSEERYRTLVNNIPGMVFRCANEPTWPVEFLSDRCEQLTGYPAADFLEGRRTLDQSIHPDDRDVVYQRIQAQLTEQASYFVEYRFLRPDGSICWVQEYGQAKLSSTGQVLWLDGVVIDTTERKCLELALKASETKLNDILNTAIAAITSIKVNPDRQFEHLYLSAGCAAIFGYSPEDLLEDQEKWFSRVPQEDLEQIILPSFDQIYAEAIYSLEYRFRHKNGSLRWISGNYKSSWDEARNSWIVVGVNFDVTQRKQAEMALQETQLFLQLVMDMMPQTIFWKDCNSLYLGCNQSLAQIAGFDSPEQMIGKTDFDMPWTKIEADWYRACDREVIDSKVPKLGIIETQLRADGKQTWLETNKVPLQDTQGNVIGILGTFQDITDRKRSEATLQEQEQFLRSIYEGVNQSIFVVDVLESGEFRYVGLNPAYEQMTGLTTAEVQGKPPRDVLPPEVAAEVQRRYQSCVDAGKKMTYEEHLSFQGQKIWWLSNLTPLRNDQGQIYRLVGSCTDITQRKQVEAALQEFNQELELRVQARTQELENSQALLYKQKQEFRTLAENSPNPILRLDKAFRFLYVNPIAAAIAGIPTHEFIGKTSQELGYPEALAQQWEAGMQAARVLGQEQSIEFSMTLHQGLRYYQSRISPEFAPDGTVESFLVILSDITERKETEILLRQQAQAKELLAVIAQTINQSFQLKEVLTQSLEQIRQFLKTDRIVVYRFNSDGSGIIELEALFEPRLALLGQVITDPCFDKDWIDQYKQGYISVLPDTQAAGVTPCHAELLARLQVRANLAVPILRAGEIWGLLIAHQCDGPRHWQSFEVELLKQLGLQIGIASQKADLYLQLETELAERCRAEQALEQQVQRERLLRTVSQQIRQSLKLEDILNTTVAEVQRVLQADRALIFQLNSDRSGVVIQEARSPQCFTTAELFLTDEHFPAKSYEFYLQGQARA